MPKAAKTTDALVVVPIAPTKKPTFKVEKKHFHFSFTEDVLGSWPVDQDLLTQYVTRKAPAQFLTDEENSTGAASEDVSHYTCFAHDAAGLLIYGYVVKGFLKESANVNKDSLGVKNLRSKIDNYVFVNPRRIHFLRNGKPVVEPDDLLERPIRCLTAMGPRVALTGSERIRTPVDIYFTVDLLQNREVTWKIISALMDYGTFKGIGQWRNGSWGTFTWEEIPKLPF